jgi:Zn-dependent M28 family amino/carboxypeptidase
MKNWIGFVAAMLVAVGLGILGTTPPRPLPADAAQTEFSASRAMAHVRRVAARPHPTGSAENAAVRSYIAEQLRGLGLEVREAEAALPQAAIDRMALLSKGALVPEKLVNVIGVLPGKNRAAPAVALMTHHDTVWGSPGAADDTAGVATILETLRAIRASGQPARDLVVVITDAEELGLSGAEAFFAADPLRGRIGTIINLEARGGGGRTTMFETSPGNGEAMRLFAGSVSRPGASSLAAYVYSVLPNDTDMSVSMRGGWPGYNFALIGRPGLYHSPKATPDRLD